MRILFDQGTPVPLRLYLTDHVVGVAADLGWERLRNGELLETPEQADGGLLYGIADESRCDGCNERIFWLKHKNGKKAPYTIAGLNHFLDRPARRALKDGGGMGLHFLRLAVWPRSRTL